MRPTRSSVSLLAALLVCLAATLALGGMSTAAGRDPIWTADFSSLGQDDAPRDLELRPGGSMVVMTGQRSTGGASTDGITAAYDQLTGNEAWSLIDDDGSTDAWRDLAFDPSGERVVLIGRDPDSTGNDDAVVSVVDADTGQPLWRKSKDPVGEVALTRVEVNPAGNRLIVLGNAFDGSTHTWIASLSAENGDTKWAAFEGDDPDEGNRPVPNDLAVGPDGTVYTLATTLRPQGGGGDIHVVAYRGSDGLRLWARTFDGPSHGPDLGNELAVAPDGKTVFVAGDSERAFATRGDLLTLALASDTGAIRWTRWWNGRPDGFDSGVAIAAAPNSSTVFVAGFTPSITRPDPFRSNDDWVVLARDADTGAKQWRKRFDGPVRKVDIPSDIAVAPDGSAVAVTGRSTGRGGDNDVAILAIGSGGETLWRAREGNPTRDDIGVGVVIGGGRVFVTSETLRPAPRLGDVLTTARALH
ncbi:MAG: PQQ-binding-like beta-propeller repeat protein [Actinomycetota bacterium]